MPGKKLLVSESVLISPIYPSPRSNCIFYSTSIYCTDHGQSPCMVGYYPKLGAASPSISVRGLALYINWWALYINWWALYINWWELCINWWGLYRKWLVAIYRILWEMVGAIYMKYWQHWISSKKEETISAKVVS